jgi:hypothetical protein
MTDPAGARWRFPPPLTMHRPQQVDHLEEKHVQSLHRGQPSDHLSLPSSPQFSVASALAAVEIDGRPMLIAGHDDGQFVWWDLASQPVAWRPDGFHRETIHALTATTDVLIATSRTRVRAWELRSDAPLGPHGHCAVARLRRTLNHHRTTEPPDQLGGRGKPPRRHHLRRDWRCDPRMRIIDGDIRPGPARERRPLRRSSDRSSRPVRAVNGAVHCGEQARRPAAPRSTTTPIRSCGRSLAGDDQFPHLEPCAVSHRTGITTSSLMVV